MDSFLDLPDLLTVEEAAEYLGVGAETIRIYTKRKLNPLPIIIISPKIVRINKQYFLEWVKGQETKFLDEAVMDNKIFVDIKDEDEKV